jgi:hypothetical protein
VIALFVGLLGMPSLSRLPLQLFPDINRPEISIQCTWRTASPEEVESELLEPLANVLQGLPGVEEIEGNATPGASEINLRFALGTDMKNALVEVIGRLNRLRPLRATAPLQLAHIIPISRGGGASPDNLMLLCANCHFTMDRQPREIELVTFLAEVLSRHPDYTDRTEVLLGRPDRLLAGFRRLRHNAFQCPNVVCDRSQQNDAVAVLDKFSTWSPSLDAQSLEDVLTGKQEGAETGAVSGQMQ